LPVTGLPLEHLGGRCYCDALVVCSGLPAHYLTVVAKIFKKYGKACRRINEHTPFRGKFSRSFGIQIDLIFIEAISAISAVIVLDFAKARDASHVIHDAIKIAREKKATGPTG
jgi:hypothetical protein